MYFPTGKTACSLSGRATRQHVATLGDITRVTIQHLVTLGDVAMQRVVTLNGETKQRVRSRCGWALNCVIT